MPIAEPLEVEDQKADHKYQSYQEENRPDGGKDSQRTVHGVRADDGGRGVFEVLPHVGHQARGTFRRIGAHWHRNHPRTAVARLDDGFERVGVIRQDDGVQRHVAGHGPEAAGGIRHVQPGSARDHPAADHLQAAFERREGLQGSHPAVANDQFGLASQDGAYQKRDVGSIVLVVGIGVNDQIRPQPQAGLQPGSKGNCQPGMVRQAQHMVHPAGARSFRCSVRAAVIDHQKFDFVHPVDLARQLSHCLWQGFGLVITRDLNDKFHAGDWAPVVKSFKPKYITAPVQTCPPGLASRRVNRLYSRYAKQWEHHPAL